MDKKVQGPVFFVIEAANSPEEFGYHILSKKMDETFNPIGTTVVLHCLMESFFEERSIETRR